MPCLLLVIAQWPITAWQQLEDSILPGSSCLGTSFGISLNSQGCCAFDNVCRVKPCRSPFQSQTIQFSILGAGICNAVVRQAFLIVFDLPLISNYQTAFIRGAWPNISADTSARRLIALKRDQIYCLPTLQSCTQSFLNNCTVYSTEKKGVVQKPGS